MEQHGIGEAKAAQIKAAIELGRRLTLESPEERPRSTARRTRRAGAVRDVRAGAGFSMHSHGFRPGLGCHTALLEVRTWSGTKWFVEGDISQYFDTIDHSTLIDILAEKIKDNRFLRLIYNLLRAGYMEQWSYNRTYSGTPQGGVLSTSTGQHLPGQARPLR